MATRLRKINTRVLKQPVRGPKMEYYHATSADVAVWCDTADGRLLDIEITWESPRYLRGRAWAMWSWDKGWRTGMIEVSSPLVRPTQKLDGETLREVFDLFSQRLTIDKRFGTALDQLGRAIKAQE